MNEFFKELGELLAKHNVEIDVDMDSRDGYNYYCSGLTFTKMRTGEFAEVSHKYSNLDADDCQLLAEKNK